jgi:pimeloyl-ACP methyl ester carboxylesterase
MPVANVNGTSLYYMDEGSGTAVICIHPPVLTSRNFSFQVKELSSSFRMLAPDIRGHGKSQPSEQPVTYPLIVEDVIALMDRLHIEKAFFCGYSTGGSIVLEALLTHADRILGGIIIGGMSEVSDRNLKKNILLGVILSRLKAIRTIALSVSWTNSVSWKHFLKLYREAKRCHAKSAEQYYRYSLTYNCTDQLHRIDRPIMLVYGEKDKAFHAYANLLHERLPKNELHFMPDVDHRVPTKAHERMNRLITQFINKHPI